MAVVVDNFELGQSTLLEFSEMDDATLARWLAVPEALEEYLSRRYGADTRATRQRTEHRFSMVNFKSLIEREVVRVNDNCPECTANNDPRAIPLHPNCDCEVVTKNLVTGVERDAWQPVETWLRENGKLHFVQGNVGHSFDTGLVEAVLSPFKDVRLSDVKFDPATLLAIPLSEARWSDLEKWLAFMEPFLATGEYVIGFFVEDPDLAEVWAADLATAATLAEVGAELIERRMFIGLIKLVLPL